MLLIFDTITWKPHIETAMEIALAARDVGKEVVYCNLRRGLPACEDRSPLHALLDLPEVRIRRAMKVLAREGIAALRAGYDAGSRRRAMVLAREMVSRCIALDDIKRLQYLDFFDLGWGVISSLVSVTLNARIDLRKQRAILIRYCAAGILVYDKACELIEELKPTEAVLFNGRFATTRAVMRAAEAKGIPWKIHERGGNKDRYWLTDCVPHDMNVVQRKIREAWQPDHVQLGNEFFLGRRNRQEQAWHSFARRQHEGHLPAEMEGPGAWATFFTSAEDEMIAIGDSFTNPDFPTQLDAINALLDAAGQVPGMRVCIRIHPHIAQKSQEDQRKWAADKFPGALVIAPADVVDSYALLDRSKVVCTYASTMGIEATYWGRPSLLFSPSYYDELGVCQMAGSHPQLVAFLRDPLVFPRENTLPYGAFWQNLGEPYRYYRPDDLHRGSICGDYLDDSRVVLAARNLLRLLLRKDIAQG